MARIDVGSSGVRDGGTLGKAISGWTRTALTSYTSDTSLNESLPWNYTSLQYVRLHGGLRRDLVAMGHLPIFQVECSVLR